MVGANNMVARSLRSAVGLAVFGAIVNAIFGPGDVRSIGSTAIQAGSAAASTGVLIVPL